MLSELGIVPGAPVAGDRERDARTDLHADVAVGLEVEPSSDAGAKRVGLFDEVADDVSPSGVGPVAPEDERGTEVVDRDGHAAEATAVPTLVYELHNIAAQLVSMQTTPSDALAARVIAVANRLQTTAPLEAPETLSPAVPGSGPADDASPRVSAPSGDALAMTPASPLDDFREARLHVLESFADFLETDMQRIALEEIGKCIHAEDGAQ